jgi:hypothetical protein
MAADPQRSRWWELEHSWWLGLIAIGCGFLTWAGFGYVALRTKQRRWFAWAAFYLVLLSVSTYFLDAYDEDQWPIWFGVLGLLGCWVGGFVHALAVRGEALDLLSLDEDPRGAGCGTAARPGGSPSRIPLSRARPGSAPTPKHSGA